MRITWRLTLTTAALVTAYYFLVGAVAERLPWAVIPSWWWLAWPSRHSAFVAWLQALNIVEALAAALPISVIITLFVRQYQFGVTLGVAAGTAAFITIGSLMAYPPVSSTHPAELWLGNVINFAALCGSPPLLVWLSRSLPSNNRWRGP